jgi:ABC-type bacteriocin/lantibiotic exporter with double-glycine peptidase domain
VQNKEIGTGPCTAATLVHLAQKSGVRLRTVSLTMKELDSCAKPVIVHVDSDTPEAGSFLLLLSIADEQVMFIDGPSACMHAMSVEDFRRVWSGFALLPTADPKQDLVYGAIGFLAALLLLAVWGPRSQNTQVIKLS